jgi:hypothetical protein
VGQPLIAAAPATEAPPVALVELVAEALVVGLVDAVALWLEDVAAAGVPLEWVDELVVELEPPQALTATARTAASGARPSGRRGVLTAPTLAKPVFGRRPGLAQAVWPASPAGDQSPR